MDISQNVWNETDASNNTAAPDGAPEGMATAGVNDVIRADRGAIKRWYNQTIPKLTGGTSTAFTLTYGVAPTALAHGMTHLVQFNQACGASPTLNVNGLGAIPLHKYAAGAWGVLAANNVTTDTIARPLPFGRLRQPDHQFIERKRRAQQYGGLFRRPQRGTGHGRNMVRQWDRHAS
jgi:hypothetical protein